MTQSVSLVPLSVVFATVMSGCCGKDSTTYYTETVTYSEDEVISIVATTPDGSGDTDDAVVPDHSCSEVCRAAFGYDPEDCSMSVDGTPIYTYSCDLVASCEGGRFHAVVQTTQRASGTSKTGVWLAQMAHDEAASASAFVALEVELRAHHAPADLRRRVLEAAADEVRHASMIRTLAEPRGGVVPPSVIGDVPPRDLFAIAIENVVEGCVKETWLAMRAHVQAEVATDPQIAAALRVIAVDETRHAELARELDGWMRSKLSPADNRRLNAARDEAVAQLTLRIDQGDEMSFAEAGLPSAEEQARLVRALTAALWT